MRVGQVWWFMPVIPVLRSLRQGNQGQLGYTVRPCLKSKNKTKKQTKMMRQMVRLQPCERVYRKSQSRATGPPFTRKPHCFLASPFQGAELCNQATSFYSITNGRK
jgi:hypothetical protein